MRSIEEVAGVLLQARGRLQDHARQICRQNENISQTMQQLQGLFGDQPAGQQAVRELYSAVLCCGRADSTLYRVQTELDALAARMHR